MEIVEGKLEDREGRMMKIVQGKRRKDDEYYRRKKFKDDKVCRRSLRLPKLLYLSATHTL